MQPRWTILAASLFALAIALVAFQHDRRPTSAPTPGLPVGRNAKPQSATEYALAHSRSRAAAAATQESRSNPEPSTDGNTRSQTRPATDSPAPGSSSRAALEIRAQLVERDADRELARLIPLLDLTPEQQQRVFQALARTSPNFVPGMLVDGSTLQPATGNPQQTLLTELSDDQIAAYLEDSNERSAWWSEYISGIAAQLDSGTPALDGGTATVATVPATESTTPAATTPAIKDAHAISEDE